MTVKGGLRYQSLNDSRLSARGQKYRIGLALAMPGLPPTVAADMRVPLIGTGHQQRLADADD